jgi:predicted house-cleaning noncanonical NTP pyrophosphatase (MazG superfamily)
MSFKNLNYFFKLPILQYNKENENFEKDQVNKLLEEIEEFQNEKDLIKKCCELFDIIQVVFSLLNLFSLDDIDQSFRLNIEKHRNRGLFQVLGYFDIFKLLKK